MTLDVSTLTFAGGFVALASGLFLLVYWLQDRIAWAAFWWAGSSVGLGIGIVSLALHGALPRYASEAVAPLLLDAGAALAWIAARVFNRRSMVPRATLAGLMLVPPSRWEPAFRPAYTLPELWNSGSPALKS